MCASISGRKRHCPGILILHTRMPLFEENRWYFYRSKRMLWKSGNRMKVSLFRHVETVRDLNENDLINERDIILTAFIHYLCPLASPSYSIHSTMLTLRNMKAHNSGTVNWMERERESKVAAILRFITFSRLTSRLCVFFMPWFDHEA